MDDFTLVYISPYVFLQDAKVYLVHLEMKGHDKMLISDELGMKTADTLEVFPDY